MQDQMLPAPKQNSSASALPVSKHSAESDSPSSTNLGSDLVDIVGTPVIVGMSESESHTEPVKGKRTGGEESGHMESASEQSEPGSGSLRNKPTSKRKLVLPDKVISNILDHTFRLSLSDPIYAPLSTIRPPYWRILYRDQSTFCMQFDYRWKMLEFATWLKDCQMVDDTWSAIVENHPFWAEFLSQRPTFIRDGDRGSSRIVDPRWNDRVQPGRKEPKMHSSLRAEAENTCWLCVLQHGPANMPFPPTAKVYLETTPFHNMPVCDPHAEHDLCHCCLQLELPPDILHLCAVHDYGSFHLDDPSNARVCLTCRFVALQKALMEFPIKFTPSSSLSILHYNYLHLGRGTAVGAIEHMYATCYAQTYLGLDDEYVDALKAWRNEVRIDCEKRRVPIPQLHDSKLPLERMASLLENTVQTAVDNMIDEGRWISPRFLNDLLIRAMDGGVDPERALPAIHVLNSPLTEPSKMIREMEVTNDWPMKDRPAPDSILDMMETDYITLLPERVEGAMQNLKTMIFKIAQGNLDIAEAKATSMDSDELLAWLNDPRNHIKNWWNSQPFIKSITPTCVARAFAETAGDPECGTKRKRDDNDSSADQKADKVAKTREWTASAAADSDAKMEMAQSTAGSPTPTEKDGLRATTPVEAMQISLATLTPERINRLPWPKPQRILTSREAEYLSMTEFEKAGVQWDSVYSVPAFTSELDDTTKDILMEVWQSVTKPFSACRCTICKRAIEYEKEVAAAENNAQVSQYLSLIASGRRAENMTDHHRAWLADQANLLHDAITLPGEHYSPLTTEDGHEFERYDDPESDEPYELVADEEVGTEDDVSYDIPGARLQNGRK